MKSTGQALDVVQRVRRGRAARLQAWVGICVILASASIGAHVGSPDVFLDSNAGPYRVLVTVRPPYAVPGIADVEILATSDDVQTIRIVPLPLTGAGARFAPVPDVAERSAQDPRLFTGHLWMMSAGAWQVRVTVSGDRGEGALAVPVPTLPQATLAMTRPLRAVLFALMMLLCAGFIAIAAAIAREAGLDGGKSPDQAARWRGRIAGAIAAAAAAAVVLSGNSWWSAEASSYSRYVYKPLQADAAVASDGRLKLALSDPGWIASRHVDDFVPDHGHIMHLFIVSPSLDRLWHLHPDATTPGGFEQTLPDMPAGEFDLFADVVHQTGVSETITGQLNTPAVHGAPLSGDDSAWSAPDQAAATSAGTANGTRIVWVRDERQPLRPKQLTLFTFRVDDASGAPATDLQLYMGMPGHAVFVRRDRRVFAHVHPAGSVPMAALALAMPPAAVDPHAHHAGSTPATVSFPYGFPESGDYRIFVQVKRAGGVHTGAFDARVE